MQKAIHKVAIANRGEIALRLLLACREMGLKTVLLYSSADRESKAFRMSEEKIFIGPGDPVKSYLNVSAVVEGALSAGADALHPGYGFLSESADLAKACEEKGVVFIGPPISCLELFGDKVLSRRHAISCGVPVLPASSKEDPSELLREAKRIGFPVILKSRLGGGGRGLRVISSEKQWAEALRSAKRETKSSFASTKIFVEKYLDRAKHIEVQIFADSSGKMHYLFDRDCSVQRKHQKIIEEAPSLIPTKIQKEMASAAVELFRSVRYVQAGTVEFLYQDEKFYFMEVNPRLQVESSVTEMILGVDLVKAQILTASNYSCFVNTSLFHPRGHSIECRIYTEDVKKGVPLFGRLGSCVLAHGVNRRFDMGFESGDKIPEFYDSMIGKIVVWDENRTRALAKMKSALSETIIFGLKTNLNFLQDIIVDNVFIEARVETSFIERSFLKTWQEPEVGSLDAKLVKVVRNHFSRNRSFSSREQRGSFDPWKHFSK